MYPRDLLKDKSSSHRNKNRNLKRQSLSMVEIISNQRQILTPKGNRHSEEDGTEKTETIMLIMDLEAPSHPAALVHVNYQRTEDLAKRNHQTSTALKQMVMAVMAPTIMYQ
jgi:hypothetical protein